MNILFYLAHPAHFHLFKNTIELLSRNGHKITITIKSKDVLEKLLNEENYKYNNILINGRKGNKLGIAWGLIVRSIRHFKLMMKKKFDIILSSSGELGFISKLLNIHFINVFEDDLTLFPGYNKILIPFVDTLLVPESCNTVNWSIKTIKYNGNQELAYLHPKYFKPDIGIAKKYLDIDKKNFIIRFSKLDAWHDSGKKGISEEIFKNVIDILKPYGNILITSENNLKIEYERYCLKIPASDIHHILFYCDLYIGDSQTMTAEAAVLGTPAIRFNDFVGKIGYLEELEKHGLAFGIKTNNSNELYSKIIELIKEPDLKEKFRKKREEFLKEKIDVTSFIVWFIENYPESIRVMKGNPEYQYRFK